MKNLFAAIFLISFFSVRAQDTIERWYVGADLHIGNGQVIQAGVLGIKAGKIIYAGEKGNAPIGDSATWLENKHIYPGFIALNSVLGLSEIEAARPTNDYGEVGEINANVRSAIAFNTDSKVMTTVVSNGILMAQVCPRGGLVSGSSSVMKLRARNWEEAGYKLDEALHINWPNPNYKQDDENQRKHFSAQVEKITALLQQAKSYAQQKNISEQNLKLEALKGIFNGSKKVFVHADDAKAIIHAVNTLTGFGITPVIAGAEESYLITGFLKQNNIGVIISRTHRLPVNNDDAYDASYKLPAHLKEAGVQFAISEVNFWEQRNLPFEAGQAVGFGLEYEEAVKAITLTPAKMLGIDSSTGSLEVGKDATFIISDGDVLDMRTSKVSQAFLIGEAVNLNNHQKELYEKYYELYFKSKP